MRKTQINRLTLVLMLAFASLEDKLILVDCTYINARSASFEIRLRLGKLQINLHFRSPCTNFVVTMKNLARHIELLLRDNDCVILPGFGGFIAHDVPAYYVGEEGLYYPPTRSISFNAAISMNDGLLAQSYMKSYQVDYARANYMIDMAMEQLTDMLDEEGCVTLPRIGTITQDAYQSLQFTPDAAGIASPKHFGLGAFLIKELSQLSKPAEVHPKDEAQKTKTISIHINKEMLHRVMSTAAIFLLLIMVALPTGNHRPTDIASLHLTELITAPQVLQPETESPVIATEERAISEVNDQQPIANSQQPQALEEATPIIETESTEVVTEDVSTTATEEAVEITVPIAEVPQTVAIAAQPTKTYHIIVASLPSHRGADETLAQYTRQGYTSASLVERDDRVRISLVQFTDKDEANRYLSTLRQNEKFQNAWLLAVRN